MGEQAQTTTTPAGAATSGTDNQTGQTASTATPASGSTGQAQGATTTADSGQTADAGAGPGKDGKVGLLTQKGNEQGQTTPPGNGAELEIKLPDGVQVDAAMLDSFRPVAAEVGLDSEKASRLAGWYAEQVKANTEAQLQAVEKQSTEWAAAIKVDPDVGGAKLEGSVSAARSAIDRFGGDPLRAEIDKYGLANNPELFKFCVRVGQAIAEDSTRVPKAPPGGGPLSYQERIQKRYDHPDSRALLEQG